MAFFRKQQRLPNGIQNVFLLFSEAKRFLIFSPYQLVCALLLRENEKGRKNYKNIFSVDEKLKKRKRFSKKDEKSSNELIDSNFQFAELE